MGNKNITIKDLNKEVLRDEKLIHIYKDHLDNIEHLVYKDYLTGIYNRRSFFKIYNLIKNDIKIKNLVFFILDLDDFKVINDFFGHNIGDLTLKSVAHVLSNTCKHGYVARIAGDEFIILYENLKNPQIIETISNTILKNINNLTINQANLNSISASIGIVIEKNNENNINNLLIKGDLALYEAKRLGKNTSVMFTPDLENEKKIRIDMVNDLMNDISIDKNVCLYYQPKYTCNKKLVGFEALFRWYNEKYSNIPIYKIINILEDTKYFEKFNNYIIKKALKFSKKINKDLNNPIHVAINISAKQLMNDNFINNFLALINKEDVSTNTIGIELTETVLLKDLNKNTKKIKNLKDLGILIYLDDFGTGYSSLNYLIILPLSRVKIDKYFISKTDQGEKYIKILKAIVYICHILDLPVIAEGVETFKQLELLKNLDVDYIQGYIFSKPLSEDDAYNLVIQNNYKRLRI